MVFFQLRARRPPTHHNNPVRKPKLLVTLSGFVSYMSSSPQHIIGSASSSSPTHTLDIVVESEKMYFSWKLEKMVNFGTDNSGQTLKILTVASHIAIGKVSSMANACRNVSRALPCHLFLIQLRQLTNSLLVTLGLFPSWRRTHFLPVQRLYLPLLLLRWLEELCMEINFVGRVTIFWRFEISVFSDLQLS